MIGDTLPSSTTTTESVLIDISTESTSESLSEAITTTTEGVLGSSTDIPKETTSIINDGDITVQPIQTTSGAFSQGGEELESTTIPDEMIEVSNEKETTKGDPNSMETTTLSNELSSSTSTMEETVTEGGGTSETELSTTAPSVDVEDEITTVVFDKDESINGVQNTDDIIDNGEQLSSTTETIVTTTNVAPVETTSMSGDLTPITGSTVTTSNDNDMVDEVDDTTLSNNEEGDEMSSTETSTSNLQHEVEETSHPADIQTSSETMSTTTSASTDITSSVSEIVEADNIDETTTLIAESITTDIPTSSEPFSESEPVTTTVPEINVSTDADIDESFEEAVSTVQSVAQSSNEPSDITTSNDLITDDYPEEDLQSATTMSSTTANDDSFSTTTVSTDEEGKTDLPVSTSTEPVTTTLEDDTMIRCLVNDIFYNHTDNIPSDNKCEFCQCVNGIKVCAERECPPPPANYKNCQKVEEEGNCCPKYECDEITTARSEEDEAISTSRQPNEIGVTDIVSGPETTSSNSEDIEILPETVEAMTQTTEMNQSKDDDDIEAKEKCSMMGILLGNCQPQVRVPVEGNIIDDGNEDLTTLSPQTTSKAEILDDDSDDDSIYFSTEKIIPTLDDGTAEDTLADRDSDNEILDDDSDDVQPGNGCTIDGQFFNNLDQLPSQDPCQLCHCAYGAKLCASRDCAVPVGFEDCEPLPTAEGKCCPDQFECSK